MPEDQEIKNEKPTTQDIQRFYAIETYKVVLREQSTTALAITSAVLLAGWPWAATTAGINHLYGQFTIAGIAIAFFGYSLYNSTWMVRYLQAKYEINRKSVKGIGIRKEKKPVEAKE